MKQLWTKIRSILFTESKPNKEKEEGKPVVNVHPQPNDMGASTASASHELTKEQQKIVLHPSGHARVLAVAGSGKTSTMVARIAHLIHEKGVDPASILVLMFNRLAKEQFDDRLEEAGIKGDFRPKVYTFHAFAFRFINALMQQGQIPRSIDLWVGERSELHRLHIKRAIESLQRNGVLNKKVSADEAMIAISLWKGALIPPARAGHKGNTNLPLVYAEFEKLRIKKQALTFDDFVPMLVEMLTTHNHLRSMWCDRMDHIIVDEYQDVNHGQQRMLELIAGKRADMMVVGDDDQTIYEWRGARPTYITEQFVQRFNNKPHATYHLSASFRFGPVLAQSAYNVIRYNTQRVDKHLIAHFPENLTNIHILTADPADRTSAAKSMADEITTLVLSQQVPPTEIVALCRLYAQLATLEIECLTRKIPYRIVGQNPFFERQENIVLLNYVRLSQQLDRSMTSEVGTLLLSVLNKPTRYLPRQAFKDVIDRAVAQGDTLQQVLEAAATPLTSSLSRQQQRTVRLLIESLRHVATQVAKMPAIKAGELLQSLCDQLNYLAYFDHYYGEGEASFDRKQSVIAFIAFAQVVQLDIGAFLTHLQTLDTTQGAARHELITMTSIYRAKGLEYDYVLMPHCVEGFMPHLSRSEEMIFDTDSTDVNTKLSPSIEQERRLFYVGLTRAQKAVYLGTIVPDRSLKVFPSRFVEEIELEATRQLYEPLHELKASKVRAAAQLRESIPTVPSAKRISEQTLPLYFERNDASELAAELRELAAGQTSEPFAYSLPYRSDKPKADDSKPESKLTGWNYVRVDTLQDVERQMAKLKATQMEKGVDSDSEK